MKTFACYGILFAMGVINLQASGGKNTIALSSVPTDLRLALTGADCHSIVGIRVDPHSPAAISLAEISRVPGSYHGVSLPRLSGINALSADRFTWNGGTLSVACSGNPDVVLAIYVSVDVGINVSFSRASGVVNCQVQDGIMIRDGVVENARPQGLHTLVAEGTLLSNDSTPLPVGGLLSSNDSPASAMGGLKLFGATVSLSDLKSHLQTYSLPKLQAPKWRAGVLRIEIDETGHISDVSGPPWAANAAVLAAVREWVFSPFTSGGAPTKVIGVVPFRVDGAGTVLTALDQAATVY